MAKKDESLRGGHPRGKGQGRNRRVETEPEFKRQSPCQKQISQRLLEMQRKNEIITEALPREEFAAISPEWPVRRTPGPCVSKESHSGDVVPVC